MQQQVLRETIEQTFLKFVRFYTSNTPISKGKYRLYLKSIELCRYPPKKINVRLRDGRRYLADLTDEGYYSVFFLGEFEPVVTDIISSVVRKNDVCLDIGANFGWYTTLLHRLIGDGEIHAFEPIPETFANLKQNYELAGEPRNVFLNNTALGDENKMIDIHRFTDLPSGFSSFSTQGKNDFQTFSVPMVTLDSYLSEKKVRDINFIKIDVEGAELMFLHGATKLFEQQTPPLIMAEMALGTTKGFGYLPNDLLMFIKQRADYEFYAVDDVKGTLLEIEEFAPDDIGANVLCFPKNGDRKRIEKLKFTN